MISHTNAKEWSKKRIHWPRVDKQILRSVHSVIACVRSGDWVLFIDFDWYFFASIGIGSDVDRFKPFFFKYVFALYFSAHLSCRWLNRAISWILAVKISLHWCQISALRPQKHKNWPVLTFKLVNFSIFGLI